MKVTTENSRFFSVDERVLYLKKIPSRTFTARQGKSMSDIKASKNQLTLFLGANAAGDLKLKPVFNYLLKILGSKSTPFVLYKWNDKA